MMKNSTVKLMLPDLAGIPKIVVIPALAAFALNTNAQTLTWAAAAGSEGDDVARSIAVDMQENVIVAGYFDGTIDVDPGPGQQQLTSNGFNDIYVQKLTSAGELLWAFSAGGAEFDLPTGVATDADGNIYMTGGFTASIDLDPGAGVNEVSSTGGQDIFLAKYSAAGDLLWARAFGGTEYDESTAIAVGASGHVHILSFFSETIDADPGAAELSITSAGGQDFLLQKFTSDGDLIWAQATGASDTELGLAMALDADNNIWITGSFEGTLDFDPGAGSFPLNSAGAWDIFITKRSPEGELVWAGRVGGLENFDTGYDIAVDQDGNAVVVGSFFGSGDFDPGAGEHTLVAGSEGSDDIFVLKLDPAGNFIWAKSFGGTDADLGYGVALAQDGRIAITGFFAATADFDPDPVATFEMTTTTPDNYFDSFVSELNADGDFLHAWQFGGASSIATQSVARVGNDGVIVAGHFETVADLDPGPGSTTVSSAGFRDAFVVRFDDLSVGVAGMEHDLTISVHPNPASDALYMDVDEGSTGTRYTVTDAEGRIISKGRLTEGRNQLSLEGFAAGHYHVHVHGEKTHSLPFVVEQ